MSYGYKPYQTLALQNANLMRQCTYLNERNDKLRKFATDLLRQVLDHTSNPITRELLIEDAREVGIDIIDD